MKNYKETCQNLNQTLVDIMYKDCISETTFMPQDNHRTSKARSRRISLLTLAAFLVFSYSLCLLLYMPLSLLRPLIYVTFLRALITSKSDKSLYKELQIPFASIKNFSNKIRGIAPSIASYFVFAFYLFIHFNFLFISSLNQNAAITDWHIVQINIFS